MESLNEMTQRLEIVLEQFREKLKPIELKYSIPAKNTAETTTYIKAGRFGGNMSEILTKFNGEANLAVIDFLNENNIQESEEFISKIKDEVPQAAIRIANVIAAGE